MTSQWTAWVTHFSRNAERPMPRVDAPTLTAAQQRQLAHSLAVFQVGEAGEGRIARDIDRATLPGVDAAYRLSLKAFVKEEGRHARILKSAVEALGGSILKSQWTEGAFVSLRRLFGIRFKLLVLTVAEVMGIAFYGLAAQALPQGDLKQALLQLCDDEAAHLQFHAQFFRAQQANPLTAWLLRRLWKPVSTAAAWLLVREHASTLILLGISRDEFAARLQQLKAEVAELMSVAPVEQLQLSSAP